MNDIELIKDLSNALGASGYEKEVVEVIKKYMPGFDLEVDDFNNVVAKNKNFDKNKETIMLDAHIDEVGFMLQAILENGLLKFIPIGGWNPNTLVSSQVTIYNKDQKVKGIISSTPVHFLTKSDYGKTLEIKDMFIDVGAVSAKEVKDIFNLRVGLPAVPNVKCSFNEATNRFMGKAFDCRIGVATMIKTMHDLKDKDLKYNVVASFSSQEEVGERGILMNIKKINPRYAICFEGCPADDNFAPSYLIQAALEKGPSLRYMDTSAINSPYLMEVARNCRDTYHIKMQEAVRTGGGNNSAIAQKVGIPSIVVGIPSRYIHSHVSICSLNDYHEASQLVQKILVSID